VKREISLSSVGTGFTPLLEKAVEEGIAILGEEYEIVEISETRKRSGYMIKCRDFAVLSFKGHAITTALIKLIEELVLTNPGYAVYVTPNDTTVEGFSLMVDEEVTRMWVKSKKSNVLEVFRSEPIVDIQRRKKGP
jgi:hypothetical protein